ncbi:MAG TPA: Na+/H+ antiporter NhaC [Thermoanaerobacterales bacterium]|nr:Na+/H+ antiporter NhaC [Thermoanaerobacterales bacterium]
MYPKRRPHYWEALIPVLSLTLFLLLSEFVFDLEPHIPLVLGCIVAAITAVKVGFNYEEITAGISESVYRAIEALIIIMIVGMLIGTWVLSGIIPAMVYYGLDLIGPKVFLITGCTICAVVSLTTGSSWTSSGTVGIALMGIAAGLNINPALSAGMVISGAYFGDKLSPFSDSTNVAAAAAETNLYSHVSSMLYTTIPSFIIALIIYGFIGLNLSNEGYNPTRVKTIQSVLTSNFSISPLLMIPPIYVILAAIKKCPPIPSLLSGALLGGLWAILFQGVSLQKVLYAMHYGFKSNTGLDVVDKLLSRGGVDSMMWTISLIMFALAFGGIMEKAKFSEVLLEGFISRVKSVGSLITVTIITAIISDFILTDQYLSLIVPGRAYAPLYDKLNLDRRVLSRSLEDGGTLWSPLCPWNGCGIYQSATLGVSTFSYLPYAFFNLVNPLVSIIMAYIGWGIFYVDDLEQEIYLNEDIDIF